MLKYLVIAFLSSLVVAENRWDPQEEDAEFWLNLGKEELELALQVDSNTNVAKNVIILIGDGMSVPTITAGRILKGQLEGNPGEETILAMDRFPRVGLSKTYSVDKQVADSASTGTALLSGVKGIYGTIGLDGSARERNCSTEKGNEVDSILVDAFKAGKSTGLVTTTRINHATPAAAYAHTAFREWYSDADLTDEAIANNCRDIAQQFYDASDMITVALGGGRVYFLPNTTNDTEYQNTRNVRKDGQDLIAQWLQDQSQNGLSASYVWNQDEFDNVDPATTDRLLGLFEPADMNFEISRSEDEAGEPSLAEMTEKAIRILQKNTNGYFLLVEGGRIDHAHHATNAYRALHELVAFDDAIAKAVELTSDNDTMIIVTSDHSHTFTFGGYSDRGNPIFGLAVTGGNVNLGTDEKPYTSLLYGNGQGFQGRVDPLTPHVRQNLTDFPTDATNYLQQTAVPLATETHGGDDVPIMARGPMSHLIHGVHQQSYIAYVMRYASCLGNDTRHCQTDYASMDREMNIAFLGLNLDSNKAATALNAQFALLIVLFVSLLVAIAVALKQSRTLPLAEDKKGYDNNAHDLPA